MLFPRVVLTCLLLTLARPVSADTFTLTSGVLNYYSGDLGGASLAGPSLSVNGTTFGRGRLGVTVGEAVDWSGAYGFGGCGGATILGVTYAGSGDPFDVCGGRIRVTAALTVAAVPFLATPITDSAGFFQTPFSLWGTITGMTLAGAPLFAVDVTGYGTMTKGYRSIGPEMYLTEAPSLRLSESIAPAPEPSTMILFGTALAFVVWRSRRASGRLHAP